MSDESNLALYAMQVQVAAVRAWRVSWMVALGWVLFPFFIDAVLHPSTVIRALAYFQGLEKPHLFSSQQLAAGEVEALLALAVLILIQLVGSVQFYRYAEIVNAEHPERVATPILWPLAAIATGIFGNAGWLMFTGHFDPVGGLVGFSSMALTVLAEWVVNGLGRDFIMGRQQGAHPPVNQSW